MTNVRLAPHSEEESYHFRSLLVLAGHIILGEARITRLPSVSPGILQLNSRLFSLIASYSRA